jgi:hypothetical protein
MGLGLVQPQLTSRWVRQHPVGLFCLGNELVELHFNHCDSVASWAVIEVP